jgi:PAS domain S-box-containing protein
VHPRTRFSLPIGLRLALAFLAVILLTALIGLLAIQQIASLTDKTTEVTMRDLPEAILAEHLRALLSQEKDLEYRLITSNLVISDQPDEQEDGSSGQPDLAGSTPTPSPTPGQPPKSIVTNLTAVLQEIAQASQQLLTFESAEQGEDHTLARQIAEATHQMQTLSMQLQTLVQEGQQAQARTLDATQQEPLRRSAMTTLTRLSTLEQAENAQDMTETQQDSHASILFLLALTGFCLLLSIVLAILMTRSLTHPLNSLLRMTEAIAAGDLSVEPPVSRADEIGRLAAAYDKMRVSLHDSMARLRQERHQTQAIIDTTADGMLLVNATNTILTCNPAVEALTGWRPDEALGRYCWEILGFQEAAEANEHLFALLEALYTTSEPSSFEMRITTRQGKPRWLAISCAPMPPDEQGAESATVIGLHDISHLKAVEQLKSDFVAMVSHELRAPLTTVSGSVETLRLLEPAADAEAYQEVLGLLDQQTRRLRQVVDEVLQLTRFEAGRLEVQIQAVSLHPWLQRLVERLNAEWGESAHYIVLYSFPAALQVWADAGLLEIVLRNLFENARKYTPHGTAVEVEATPLAATNQVQLRVIDYGPGIPEDRLEATFERFTRGPQASGAWTRGYGLGLYIARELMQAQNGSIHAEPRAAGACFVLTLWLVTDDPATLPLEAAPGPVVEQEEEPLA